MSDFFHQATSGFLKPIAEFLEDESISEIMINGFDQVYIEKGGKLEKTKNSFEDSDQLMAAVRRIAQAVGKKIDEDQPILDGRLGDGSRIHAVIPPVAKKGIYLTIRKFTKESMKLKTLVKVGALSLEMAKFLNLCASLKKNILVSGGTSSGKTTLLNVISSLIPPDDRIVVIEDASELDLAQTHVLPLETLHAQKEGGVEVSIRDLVRASLRMRPDRIVIGEVRSGEAMDLLQAMNTGHDGSMATIHANSPFGALSRLETLAMMSNVDLPLMALRSQIGSAMEVIVQTSRLRDGSRKITHISEVLGVDEAGHYQVQDVFVYQVKKVDAQGRILGDHQATGKLPSFYREAKMQGFTISRSMFEKK
ncbi:MAG: CpaF family protein [Bdellovibrionales bacterium]|nr:CpaF family protein [Bdellovibrionales bacterium]